MSMINHSDIETKCFQNKNNGGDYKRQSILTLNKTQIHEIFRNSNVILTIFLLEQNNHCKYLKINILIFFNLFPYIFI